MTDEQYICAWQRAVQETIERMTTIGLSEEEARSIISFTMALILVPAIARKWNPSNEAAARFLGGLLTDSVNMARGLTGKVVNPRIVFPGT